VLVDPTISRAPSGSQRPSIGLLAQMIVQPALDGLLNGCGCAANPCLKQGEWLRELFFPRR